MSARLSMARSRAAAVLLCAALASCTSTSDEGARGQAPIEVDPLLPGFLEDRATRSDDPLGEIAGFELNGRRALADDMVRREPALVLAVVSRGLVGGRQRELLARALDRCVDDRPGSAGWSEYLTERGQDVGAFEDYESEWSELIAALRAGEVDDALDRCPLPVPGGTRGPAPLLVQARAMEGFVRSVAGRRDDAAQAFTAARQAASGGDVLTHARLLLLQHEFATAAGDVDAALWAEAVETASAGELVDPLFWTRARDARPAGVAWPASAVDFARRSVAPESTGSDETDALLLGLVANQRLIQADPQRALLEFTRAESESGDPRVLVRLRVGRARALLAMGRHGDAAAPLVELALSDDPFVARPALAMLGALELELLRIEHALPLLERAVGADDPVEWMGSSEALANLGVAQLLAGDAERGEQNLRAARARFEVEGDLVNLGRCLRNELQQATRSHQEALAGELRGRLEALGR